MTKKKPSTKSERKPTGFQIPDLSDVDWESVITEQQSKEYHDGLEAMRKGKELNKIAEDNKK